MAKGRNFEVIFSKGRNPSFTFSAAMKLHLDLSLIQMIFEA